MGIKKALENTLQGLAMDSFVANRDSLYSAPARAVLIQRSARVGASE